MLSPGSRGDLANASSREEAADPPGTSREHEHGGPSSGTQEEHRADQGPE